MFVSSRTSFSDPVEVVIDVVPAGNRADVVTVTGVPVTENDSVFTTGADWVHPADTMRAVIRSPMMKTTRSDDIAITVGGERK
jgi:hypothetical protein